MTERERVLNKHIKRYDRELFAEYNKDVLCIFRKRYLVDSFEINGKTLHVFRQDSYLILPLTEDWTMRTKPCEWGIEPVYQKLRDMDGWGNESPFERMVREREQINRNKEISKQNEIKARWADVRRDYARDIDQWRIGGEKTWQ